MLPAQYRMRRSADFGATVKHGRRAVQPDLVIYDRRADTSEASALDSSTATAPRVGLIIAKSVGPAVTRHRVARRLRHVARGVLVDLEPCEQLVIRALPGSSTATSEALGGQLRAGLRAIRRTSGAVR
ncbi:ribonuclease P protein component [Mycolicibacter arupensis]|uniref:Ribonuclease P protein component n=1 Tax=Mycolicibacter arupensis TaxID=342002 RepID=A0A0F5MV51_9MYCO|nr:ribonuclease P protein component [Mycolicibacter arupensis]KAA1431231.1 ribonuclease P protein component [Mycolicibacter arupensis]KKB98645.1 ribonuclease P [Mycolicibacter arupensis]MCV7277769.1 ribonuclease P protein component [Mycolicibacter arupensis]OQZ96125.1 ribonuclease P protein component [Mycolicibacter arupensis]